MTFYESALRVLEEAGKPLTHVEITQLSMDKGLLSHVGKMPEVTMLARLAAMAKRPRDRKLLVTAKDTFALTDWMLPEDPAALAATGVPEANPEEGLPPLRPIERHPEPSSQNARGVGRERDRDRKRRDRDEERKKRFPPIGEVAFEALEELGGAATCAAILEKARSKELCGPELGTEKLLYALVEDNQRRIDAGRRPQFHWRAIEGAEAQVAIDPNSEVPAGEIQAALCKAAEVPFENGRAVLKVREQRSEISTEDAQLFDAARLAVKDARRAQARSFRKLLADLELGALEKALVKLLHTQGFREVRVARRSREGLLLTSRRKDGSLEYRQAVRLLRGNASIERRHVQELRRDLSQVGAQVGLICSAGDVRGDARGDAVGQGAMVQIWGGDALAEKFFEAETGVTAKKMFLYEIDAAFFTQIKIDAEEARLRREERQRERGDEPRALPPEGEAVAAAPAGDAPGPADAERGDLDGDDADEGDEGDEGAEEQGGSAAEGALGPDGQPQGSGRRRRRRRRRRRGGGGRPEGAPGGAPGQSAAPAEGASAEPPPPPPPAPAASGGGESSGA
jgi:ribonuclease E